MLQRNWIDGFLQGVGVRAIIASILAVIGSSAGLAADLPARQAPPTIVAPPIVPIFVWAGPYAGVNVGYIGGYDRYDYTVAPEGNPVIVGSSNRHGDGVIGGAQIGYNFAIGNVVFGPEADFDGSSLRSSGTAEGLVFTGTNVTLSSRLNYLGTVRGRLGYSFDRLLIYGTGGFAYANVTQSTTAPELEVATRTTNTHTGYAVGGGLEFAVSRNLILRAEYLRVDLGRRTVIQTDDENLAYRFTQRPVYNIGRVGLSYLFAAPIAAPVVARY